MKKVTLTDEQKDFLAKSFPTNPDLNKLTKECFCNEELDGRSAEGRAVREFLSSSGLEYSTTQRMPQRCDELTETQKEFILQRATEGLSSFEIAKQVWPDVEIKNLSKEVRAVLACIRAVNPDWVHGTESALFTRYSPPKAASKVIKKIYDSTGIQLEEERMHKRHKDYVDKLLINLSNSRFCTIMNGFESHDSRKLFEEEFIRLTWDKPDLTADEVTLYMNVCKDVVMLENISKNLAKLHKMFEETEEQNELSVRLAETIKAKSKEYHDSEGRIESLIKRLQGDRSARLAKRHESSASILNLVQAFMEEEERQIMLNIVEKQKLLIDKEAQMIESLPEFKARVLGIGREDVV
jgi:uncharacterized protein YukE